MYSLRAKLTALVAVIVAGVLAIVALWVLPSLGSALKQKDLGQLADAAREYEPVVRRQLDRQASVGALRQNLQAISSDVAARVTLLGIARTPSGREAFVKASSGNPKQTGGLQFPVALIAAATGRPETAVEASTDARVGEAAIPVVSRSHGDDGIDAVLVLSRPLDDQQQIVSMIGVRMLAAGVVGLVLATLAGLLVADALARRVTRLEHAAKRVAGGDMGAPFATESRDELGALAAALDDMRLQLAELDSARKRFIATASHELRTPLFSLGGFLELLEDEDVSETDRARFVTQLREQVTRMQRLATDLLDLSRLEAGSLELSSEPTDLRDLARLVAGEFEPTLQAHDAHLELRLPQTPVNALCDPERVAQLLRILLDNAIAHTLPGTDIVIASSVRDGRARIGVADYGPGIARTVLPTIFEPFATTDDRQGAGLGLAIARELAARMGGNLRVESRPGLTSFTLEIELVRVR